MLLFRTLFTRLQSPKEEGSDAGGSEPAADRGDDLPQDTPVVEKPAADDTPAAGNDDKPAGNDTDDDDKPRDENGRFAARIPKARFDEAVEKERTRATAAEERAKAAEAELARLKDGTADIERLDKEIDELEEQLDAAVADGNKDKVRELRKKAREAQERKMDLKADQRARQATALAVAQVNYDSLLGQLERDYPIINPDSEQFDEAVMADVVDLKEAFEAKGLGTVEALKKAANMLLVKMPAKSVETKPDDKAAEAEAKAQERREAAVRKGVETRVKQPAAVGAAGKDSTTAGGSLAQNVGRLSDKDFDDLPEDKLRKLRGDDL